MTDHKLRLIPGPAKREPSPGMLHVAELILQRVKTGEIRAIAVVLQHEDGGHSSSIEFADESQPVALVGELAVLQGDLVRHEIDLRRNIPRG